MKIRISDVLVLLTVVFLVTSIHVIEFFPPVFSTMRIFRLLIIPVLVLIGLILLPKQPIKKLEIFLPLALPTILILIINTWQLFALPPALAATHASITVRYASLFLLYLCTLLSINTLSINRLMSSILAVLSAIFLIGVFQYPFLIAQAGTSLGYAISNYGKPSARSQLDGILGSANENANGCIMLFPLVLLWVENNNSGLRRLLFRGLLFFSFSLALVFNGTRTALVISLPLLTFLFYSKLSLRRILYLVVPISVLGGLFLLIGTQFTDTFFASEADGGGTFGWRIEQVWIPAIQYTLDHSPLYGFGSRGWEYIGEILGFQDSTGVAIAPAHSGYVWTLVSWGVPGFLAYVSLLGVLLVESFRLAQSRNPEVSPLGRALFCSMLGYCIWAFISNVMFTIGWTMLIGVAMLIAALKFVNVEAAQLGRSSPQGLVPSGKGSQPQSPSF